MRSPIRTIAFVVLLVIVFVLLHQVRVAFNVPPDDDGVVKTDMGKIIMLFGGVVIVGVGLAVLFVTTILPEMTEAVANSFFNPNEKIEKDPHADARAAVQRGEFEEAITLYQEIYEKEPTDTLALSEMVKVYCEKLENPQAGAEVLEEALQKEWPADEVAFLSTRLVDVYWKFQHNGPGAKALLLQIIDAMPETRHSANAMHRLQEIDKELALEG